MEMPKTCKGCFSKWDQERTVCPHCGWDCQKEYPPMPFWNIGEVLEERYRIGKIYCIDEDIAVWRIYDAYLKIPCFALMKVGHHVAELEEVAGRLQSVNEVYKGFVTVLAIKEIGTKRALLFSMMERYAKKRAFKQLLQTDPVSRGLLVKSVSGQEKEERILPAGSSLNGCYRIIGCIGIGGFGISYLCEDRKLHRNVAVKEYFPSEWAKRDGGYVTVKQSGMLEAYRCGVQAFLKEIHLTAKFIHTARIVTLLDAFEENDTVYLVMEYIPGISIGREMRLRQYQPFTPGEAAEIVFPVLDALRHIHARQLVHSDISPGNIMRSEEGEICLIDLGAAKYRKESRSSLSAAFLKPVYAAPEQYETAREGVPRNEGPWTDLYALGATLFYLLTGHKPLDVAGRLRSPDPELVSPENKEYELEKPWREFIQRAMAMEIETRFQTVEEFGVEMRKLLVE